MPIITHEAMKRDSFYFILIFTVFIALNGTSLCFADNEKIDYYNGEFHPNNNILLTDGEAINITFVLNPIDSFSDVEVSLLYPHELITLENGSKNWIGNLEKNTKTMFNYTIRSNGMVKGTFRILVKSEKDGIVFENSYYLRVWNGLEERSLRDIDKIDDDEDFFSNIKKNAPSGSVNIYGRILYLDENSEYQPARFVDVWLYDEDIISGDDYVSYSYTDSNGYFAFIGILNEDGEEGTLDPYMWISADNGAARTLDESGYLYEVITPTAWNVDNGEYDFGELGINNYYEAFQAIDYALDLTLWIYEETDFLPDKVDINWPVGDWPESYGTGINLPEKYYYDWGPDTVIHELGHCIAFEIYGNRWPPGDGGSHYIWTEGNEGDAISEGWAEFLECVVLDDPTIQYGTHNDHGGNAETNDWYQCEDQGDMDGSYVEGSIVSILWDIYDPVNDESLSLGFDEIWNIFYNYNPDSIHEFWTAWFIEGFGNRSSLNTIFWTYGVDKNEAPSTVITSPISNDWLSGIIELYCESSDIDGLCTETEIQYNAVSGHSDDSNWTPIGTYDLPSDSWYLEWDSTSISSTNFHFRVRTFDDYEWGDWYYSEIALRLDNSLPERALALEPINNQSIIDRTPTITWTPLEDNLSGIAEYHLEYDTVVSFDSENYCEETSIEPHFTPISELTIGTWYWRVRGKDIAGNIGNWSEIESFVINPEARLYLSCNPWYGPPGSEFTVQGANFTQIAGTELEFSISGTALSDSITVDANGEFEGTLRVPAVTLGQLHTLVAVDEYGLNASADFLVHVFVVLLSDYEGPVGSEIALTCSGLKGTDHYNITFGDQLLANKIPNDSTAISTDFTVPDLPPSIYPVTISDGGWGIEATVNFTIPEYFKISGTVYHSIDPVGNVTVGVRKNNAVINTYVSEADGSYEFINLSPGVYEIFHALPPAPGYHGSGNEFEVTIIDSDQIVDLYVRKLINVTYPLPDDIIEEATPLFEWEPAQYVVYYDLWLAHMDPIETAGPWNTTDTEFRIPVDLVPGLTYIFSVRGTDENGNRVAREDIIFSALANPNVRVISKLIDGSSIDDTPIKVDGTWNRTSFNRTLSIGNHRFVAGRSSKVGRKTYLFSHWENSSGAVIEEERVLVISIQRDTVLVAVYKPRTGTVTLNIVDELSDPVDGASVYLDNELKGVCDSSGVLVVPGVEYGRNRFKVMCDGYITTFKRTGVRGDKTVEITLPGNPVVSLNMKTSFGAVIPSRVKLDGVWYDVPVNVSVASGKHSFYVWSGVSVNGTNYRFSHWADGDGVVVSETRRYSPRITKDTGLTAIYQ